MSGPGRFEVWNAANDTKLSDAYQIESSGENDDVLSDSGLVSITLGADEEAAAHVVTGNHLRCYLGTELIGTALIEPPVVKVLVDPQASKRTITLKCRGHIVAWAGALIKPFGGVDAKPQSPERPHKWSSPEMDISGWPAVEIVYDQLTEEWQSPQTDPPWFAPWFPPVGMTDMAAQWMWSRPIDPVTGHPVGECPHVKDMTVETAGLYRLEVAVDDGFDLDVDGITIGSGAESPADSFVTAWIGCFEFSAGTHRIGIMGKNYQRPESPAVGTFGGVNIGRVAFSMYYLPDGVNTVLSDALVVCRSDGSWKCLDYPETLPAPTDGAVILTHLADAQSDGALLDVTVGFSATVTTGGTPWADNGAQSFQVDDDDLFTMLQTMANARRIEYRYDKASKRLDAYNYGELGEASDAVWNYGTGLLRLTETTQPGAQSLRVRYKKGRFVLGSGYPQKSLKLADLDEPAARAQGQRELDVLLAAAPSYELELELGAEAVGTNQAPYGAGGPRLGDTVVVNGGSERLVRCLTRIGADGWPTFIPTVKTKAQGAAERQEIALSKATSGTLNGRSRAATPVDGLTQGIVAGFARRADTITFTQVMLTPPGMEEYLDTSPPRKWEQGTRIHRLDLMQFVPPQRDDTVALLVKSGPLGTTTIATLTLPVGFYRTTICPSYMFIGELDAIHMVVLSHDTPEEDVDHPDYDARWLSMHCNAVFSSPATVQPAAVDVPW